MTSTGLATPYMNANSTLYGPDGSIVFIRPSGTKKKNQALNSKNNRGSKGKPQKKNNMVPFPFLIFLYDSQNPIVKWNNTLLLPNSQSTPSFLPYKFTFSRPFSNITLDATAIMFIGVDTLYPGPDQFYNFVVGFFSNSGPNSSLYINNNSIFNALYISNSDNYSVRVGGVYNDGYQGSALTYFTNVPLGGLLFDYIPISQYPFGYSSNNSAITILSIQKNKLSQLSQTIYDGSTGLPRSNAAGVPVAPGDWINLQ
jgi:hypothetical protein